MGGRRCALPPNAPPAFFIIYPALYLSNSYSDTSLPYLPGGGEVVTSPPYFSGGGGGVVTSPPQNMLGTKLGELSPKCPFIK